MIFSLFRKDPRRTTIATLYKRVATASREPGLYASLGMPDTLEGRFEALSLHMILVLRALRQLPPPADEVAKDLTDAFFRDMDASLREMGVGDTVVPKRMKKIAESFYGRAQSYDGPLSASDEAGLASALGRNAYGSEAPAAALARYALAADQECKTVSLDVLLETGPAFPKPETFA
ncbi:ubiquinol-cytochrome C chaperone family protein [Microvirga sp. CF3062]|uniref:ubiquinol-cytochrome C chaperone family protein n=1 Tax=Microvirga sp. CF3062 TaxID=3110182 RepID=UPI002E7784D3|nr:ubiquinol-cytochrome C chaperone family protein [Microvirga sp. CF3062]MEE1656434.1 ubiquinol-cytochrome C chaperone family protein [Microvirga sp. CF3062]